MSSPISSQKQKSATTNTSIGMGGDNNGYVINGSNNSVTDYGAIDSAIDFAADAMDNLTSTTDNLITETLDANGLVVHESLDFSADIAEQAFDTTNKAMQQSFSYADGVVGNSIDLVEKAMEQSDTEAKMSTDVLKFAGVGVLAVAAMVAYGARK